MDGPLTPGGSQSPSQPISEKGYGKEVPPDDEETLYYPDFYDPAMLERLPKSAGRQNIIGHVPGVHVGKVWNFRSQASKDLVHRPWVAGIHGTDEEGCFSVALSGGYPEDIDHGVWFTFTGEGGRDLKGTPGAPKNLRTAPQSKDQTLTNLIPFDRGNRALQLSWERKLPIRVIRGYKLPSMYAPETGYRYDGLYIVADMWEGNGVTGYKIFRFRFERLLDQPPPPWLSCVKSESGVKPESLAPRREPDPQREKSVKIEAPNIAMRDADPVQILVEHIA